MLSCKMHPMCSRKIHSFRYLCPYYSPCSDSCFLHCETGLPGAGIELFLAKHQEAIHWKLSERSIFPFLVGSVLLMRKQTEKYLCSLTKKNQLYFWACQLLNRNRLKTRIKIKLVSSQVFFNSVKKKAIHFGIFSSSWYFSKTLLIFSVELVTFFVTAEASLVSSKSVGNLVLSDKIGYHHLQSATISSCFVVAAFWKH